MMIDGRVLVMLLVTLALLATLVVADRFRRLLPALGIALASLALAWGLAALAARSDYRDADGFVDCWPYCSPLQDAVGATLLLGPLAAILLVLTSVAIVLIRRVRGRV